jgi:putative glutamine amidotransferase
MLQRDSIIEAPPLIGVTVNREHYADWIIQGGGKVRLLSPGEKQSLGGINGLLLTGGEDVNPALYGEANRSARRINPRRDEFELEVLRTALDRDIPVLAICRGMQLVNVALGGKLYQDLSERARDLSGAHIVSHRGPNNSDATHQLHIESETLFFSEMWPTMLVNSHHHQGISVPARTLRAVARSTDGLIEAVEGTGHNWLLGVQWHPERWPYASSATLREAFLSACGQRRRASNVLSKTSLLPLTNQI